MVTRVVKGVVIRAFYALTILAGFSNRVCALIRKLADSGYIALSPETTAQIETGGTIVFFLFLSIFGVWVLTVFLKNLNAFRASESEGAAVKPAPTYISPGMR
jgi:hypothetical protein